jgi:hypothetical protein
MVSQILMVLALVFATVAALFAETMPTPPIRLHFGWLAVAFWLLSLLLGGWVK